MKRSVTVSPGAGWCRRGAARWPRWTSRARRADSSRAALTFGSSGVQGAAQDFSRDAGMRQVHAVEPLGVLTDGRAAADADVLGDRLDEVHGAIHVEGRARQHAVERLPGEPVRGATTQVNNGGDGADPAIRSHLPSLRRPQAGRRTVRMLDSRGVSRVSRVSVAGSQSSTAAESSGLGEAERRVPHSETRMMTAVTSGQNASALLAPRASDAGNSVPAGLLPRCWS